MFFCKVFTLFWVMTLTAYTAAVPVNSTLDSRGGVFSSPKTRTRLGYRTVSAVQARMYNSNNRLTQRNFFDMDSGRQLGAGTYLTPGPGQWPKTATTDCICIIDADKKTFDTIPKVWIPSNLWFEKKGVLTEMLAWVETTLAKQPAKFRDPEKAVRLAQIGRKPELPFTLQMLIPNALYDLKNDAIAKKLDIKVECKPEVTDFPDRPVVDYFTGSFNKTCLGEPHRTAQIEY